MPEGDTLARTAGVLRRALLGDVVRSASGRPGGAQLERIVGSRVADVSTQGKHLLIHLDGGLTLHTHLGMKGSWHRYRPGEAWRRPRARAVAVLETEGSVVVCFDAPVVELLERRALPLHPGLARLGPDLLAETPELDVALARMRAAQHPGWTIGEALLDQSVATGVGNVIRSEVLFSVGIDPFALVGELSAALLLRLLASASTLLRANVHGGDRVTMPDALGAPPGASGGLRASTARWVYGRTGRPCRRCGTPIESATLGELPRRVYWCPRCQRQR